MAKNLISGIIVRPGGLEWTLRDPAKPEASIVSRKVLPRPPPSASGSMETMFMEEKSHLEKATLHIALSASQVLMRVLELPTTDPAEITAMVELQMDEICPFPGEFMTSSWEAVARAENATRVLVCAVNRNVIEPIEEAVAAAKLEIHRLDVDVLGWLVVMRKAGRLPDRGRHIAFLFEDGATTLVLFEDGSPIILRSLGSCADEEEMKAIVEDTGYAMAAAEVEWGAFPIASATAWYATTPPPGLDLLESVCGCRPRAEALSSLDALTDGLTQRAIGKIPVINLAPPEWGEARTSREARRRLWIGVGSGLAAWALILFLFFMILGIRKGQVSELEKRNKDLKAAVAEVHELQDRVESLAAHTNASRAVMEVVLAVATALPEDVSLNELSYTKSRGFSLSGVGVSDRVLNFTDTFSKKTMFKVSSMDVQGPANATKFRVSASWPGQEEGAP